MGWEVVEWWVVVVGEGGMEEKGREVGVGDELVGDGRGIEE